MYFLQVERHERQSQVRAAVEQEGDTEK